MTALAPWDQRRPGAPLPAALARLLGRVPDEVLSTFTSRQLEALARAVATAPSRHVIELRASVPLIGVDFYVTLFAGRERRGRERLAHEGQSKPLRRLVVYFLLLSLLISTLIGFAVILYAIKSAFGIDLFPGKSIFHFVYELLYGP